MASGEGLRGRSSELAPTATILLVDDEPAIGEVVRRAFEQVGFRVLVAGDGRRGIELFRSRSPELVIVDLMLPLVSGLDVCRVIRSESAVPVIILTARGGDADRMAAFEIGADDYVTKPLSINELIARVRAHLRRALMSSPALDADVLYAGSIELNVARHEVHVKGNRVELTLKEFELLRTLMLGKGRLRTRSFLISEVWGRDYSGDTQTLDVHVKRLRHKIEGRPHYPEMIITVRGLGYRFLGVGALPEAAAVPISALRPGANVPV